MEKKNIILSKSFDFSLKVMQFAEVLLDEKRYSISNQLLKSGTSIGANIWESQNAESKVDFKHKLKIAAKEADETEYWLLLCQHSKNYPDTTEMISLLKELQKLLTKIIVTTKSR